MAAPRSPDYEYSPIPLPTATQEQSKGKIEPTNIEFGTSSVAPSLTEKSGESATQRPGWTSTYLQNTTLLAFAFAFLCLLLAVIALAVVDAKRDGIANAKSSEHYLWTYGPTAVLVIVAAFWNQVEYRAKHAMPWVLLQKSSTPASKTLFMDYTTPGKPEALWTSLRKSHWPVAITITNSFLITLLTVASTGLLVLQSTPSVRHDCQLNVTDDFVTTFNPSTIGSAPVLATLAIENGTIPFPPGTTRNGAFQNLAPPAYLSGLANVEVEGLTSSFYGGLDCEIATVESGPSGCSDWQCHGINVTLDITSPTCEIRGYNLTNGCGMRIDAVSCDVNELWGVNCDTHADGHDKPRMVFMVGQLHQDLGGADKNETEALQVVTSNTTTIVCEAKYNITDTYVTMDQNGNLKDAPQNAVTTNRVQKFPPWNLVDGLLTASDAGGLVLKGSYSYSTYNYFPWSALHKLFTSWVNIAHPSSDLKDPSVLQSHLNEMFSMATAQMAKQSLMRASADVTIGTCRSIEDRLRVRGLSLYLMGVVLVLLILSTISLLYIAPRQYSSRDPSSIGGLALVLSQSPALLSRLSTSGSADLKTMRHQLDNVDCQTILTQDGQDWRLTIDLDSRNTLEERDASSDITPSSEFTYWQPLSIRPVFKLLVIAALLILVVVLEVLYSVSRKHHGLTEVDPQHYQRFAWVYIPAIVMLTAQTLVGMVAFSSLLIFPYFGLCKGSSNTRNDILQNYASETAIKCLWQSIAAKHIVVTCMALAMLLTPLLTIAVSGLYAAQATSVQIPVTMSVQGQLNSSFLPIDIPTIGNGEVYKTSANNIGLLLTQNFTFPLWTYDELAFPEAVLELPATMNSSIPSGSNITVTLPGIRSDLNCSIAPSVPTNFSDTRGDFRRRKANVTAFEALGAYDRGSDLFWPSPGSSSFGFFTVCGNVGYETVANTFCGAFGTSEVNWNAFTCSSIINQLEVEVTIDASTFSIIGARPNESTSRLFSNETLTPGSMDTFPSAMVPSLFGSSDFGGQTSVAGYYDPVFQAVIYGLGARDSLDNFHIDDYMNNVGVDKIMDQLQHVHRTITAQSANLIRIPLNTTSPLAPSSNINATLVNPNVYRLQQSAVSTRILDGLLIAIALCIALSFGLMDTRKVLPKNPASIAAGASLIAGDVRMLRRDVLPEGTQWYSDAELKANKIWDGVLFRLGWWDSDGPIEQGGRGKYFKLDSM